MNDAIDTAQTTYKINYSTLKYCSIIVFQNNISYYDEFFKIFNSEHEHTVTTSDTIILDFESIDTNTDVDTNTGVNTDTNISILRQDKDKDLLRQNKNLLCQDKDKDLLRQDKDKQNNYTIENSNICELNLETQLSVELNYNYYSYGHCSTKFPKNIKSIHMTNITKIIYLSYIEPYVSNGILNEKYISSIFHQKKINIENNFKLATTSYYACSYVNIFNDTIAFGICKIKYSGDKISKYVIAYDSELLDKNKIMDIVRTIFLKSKHD